MYVGVFGRFGILGGTSLSCPVFNWKGTSRVFERSGLETEMVKP